MWNSIFLNLVAPILVGVVLELFSKWLNKKDDEK